MSFLKAVLVAGIASFAVPAFANIAIECGKGLNEDDGTLESKTFLISSESGRLTGRAGTSWKMFDSRDRAVRNASISKNRAGDLVLMVTIDANAIPSPVGVEYTIKNANGENVTKATVKQVGGFAGGTQTEVLDCVISED